MGVLIYDLKNVLSQKKLTVAQWHQSKIITCDKYPAYCLALYNTGTVFDIMLWNSDLEILKLLLEEESVTANDVLFTLKRKITLLNKPYVPLLLLSFGIKMERKLFLPLFCLMIQSNKNLSELQNFQFGCICSWGHHPSQNVIQWENFAQKPISKIICNE